MREIETDYLVIGAGASGMAFADTLLSLTDARVVIVDRGGWTWLRLCQAAAGVSVQFPLWWASPRVRRRRRLRPAMRMCSHQSVKHALWARARSFLPRGAMFVSESPQFLTQDIRTPWKGGSKIL